jgi:hypothetical protein
VATVSGPLFAQGVPDPVPQTPAPRPAAPPYKFSGLVFGDYYYFGQDHDAAWKGEDGLWFRRIYFTVDYGFTPGVTTRLRLEMNSNGKLEGGLLTPYVKDAWLNWTFSGRQQLILGMHPSVAIDHLESVWGMRHIEKTPLDLYKWDSSRDTGVSIAGPLNGAATLKYQFQVGNDSGNGSETDRFKAIRTALLYEGPTGLVLEGMYGFFAHDAHANRTTAQAVVAYRGKQARAAFQYATQHRDAKDGAQGPDLRLDIYSGFAVVDVKPRKVSLFARVDRYADPCPDCASIDYLPIDTSTRFTLVIAGAEYSLIPSVRFSPNVEWVHYSAPEQAGLATPSDDIVWRATFYWVW